MKPLIIRKESTRYPGLFVRKYSRHVFFDNLWDQDPALIESRGHVETADGRVVVCPFTKVFNRFENGTDIHRDETCVAIRKVNGFMAAVTWVDEVADVVVSTTGSLDSDFVTMAEEILGDHVKQYVKTMKWFMKGTYLFEIVHPNDPHIIPEEVGAYLIGFRESVNQGPYFTTPTLESILDDEAKAIGVLRPSWNIARFSTIVDEAKACKHEGFVVYGQTSKTALKIKSPYYTAKKACSRVKDISKLDKRKVDEEFYPLIDYLNTIDNFNDMDEESRKKLIEDFLHH